MTPQEKADELIDKMYYIGRYDDKEDYNLAMAWERAKQCALIAVDELIKQEEKYNNGSFYPSNYWTEVKAEIQKF